MRMKWCVSTLIVAAVAALPVAAAIKALNLEQLMSLTDDVVYGTIVDKEVVKLDHPWKGAVYTKLTVQGESLRHGKEITTEIVFHGSHDPSDDYIVSEMPELQDSRVGGKVLLLSSKTNELGKRNLVHNLAGLYRVESGFGEPVLVGKGEGFAFPENTKLSDVRERVRTTHDVLVEKAKLGQLPKVIK